MITPTGITASDYWDAIKAGNPTHVRITFLGQNIVLTDEDIEISSGVVVSDIFNDETDLVFGKAVCKQMTTAIINSSRLDGLIWTGEFTLEMGVEISGVTKWVTIGYFSGEKPNNVTTVRTIEFTAYDRMIRFDKLADNYVNNITYPTTVQNIYNGLCAFVGVDNVSGDELSNIMNRSYSSAPVEMEGYTCRDVLAWIAEACGCYATITETGKVRMNWFTNTNHVVTGDEEFNVEFADINEGMTWDEADTYTWDEIDNLTWNDVCGYEEEYAIDRIVVSQVDNGADAVYPFSMTDGNTYMIVENPFLSVSNSSDITTYIVPLYNRLIAFGGYIPFRVNCIGNWCIEAGDVISIAVNETTINVPIFTKTMSWNGFTGDEYEATGTKNRNAYTTNDNKQKVLTSKEIRLFVEGNYYELQSGIAIDPDGVKMTGGKFIDIATGSSLNNYGHIQIESGGSIDIKSGGNLNVDSGGNIDIRGSGTLALSGSTVSITSGSTFNVDSSNLKVTSNTGIMEVTDGGLKVRKEISGSNIAYNLYLGGAFGTYDEEPLKASLRAVYADWAYEGSTVRTYPVILRIEDSTMAGQSYNTNLYFGRSLFSKNNHLGTYGTGEVQIGTGVRVEASYTNNGSIIQSALESYLGIFINIDVSTVQAYRIDANSIYYQNINGPSSREIKHDIQPLPSIGEKLDGLKPVTFIYDNDENERTRMGLIYEDTIEVMPEICTQDESDKAISYVELIPALLKEIQDIRARVKTLEER